MFSVNSPDWNGRLCEGLSGLVKVRQNLGILSDKTVDDKLLLMPNDDKQDCPFCRSRFLVETFELTNENLV